METGLGLGGRGAGVGVRSGATKGSPRCQQEGSDWKENEAWNALT